MVLCLMTVFNDSEFSITQDDAISMEEMQAQARNDRNVTFANKTLLRLNQYVVHRIALPQEDGMRAFLKITFSKDRYDLLGNSRNYLMDYRWGMRPRGQKRNVPQAGLAA